MRAAAVTETVDCPAIQLTAAGENELAKVCVDDGDERVLDDVEEEMKVVEVAISSVEVPIAATLYVPEGFPKTAK